jgi:2-polyprenyl-3-methyl-5-hydroxy-6-metoxy-1,4-benzoquinol methylase
MGGSSRLGFGSGGSTATDGADAPPALTAETSWSPDKLERVARCPLCAAAERLLLYDRLYDRVARTRGRWALYSCQSCGAGYLDPRPSAASIGKAYSESYFTHTAAVDPTEAGRGVTRLKRLVRNGYLNASLGYSLRPALPVARAVMWPFPLARRQAHRHVADLACRSGGRLLDVGCGNGRLLLMMRSAGWAVEGVEPDPHARAVARRHGLYVREGRFEELDLSTASFDAITMDHVLEHLLAPVTALERCVELLRPGGVLRIATPNLASEGHRRYASDWIGLDAPRHLVLATPAALRAALERVGFRVHFKPPAKSAWSMRRSASLRAERTGTRGNSSVGSARLGLSARAVDMRALFHPTSGEELVVVAALDA